MVKEKINLQIFIVECIKLQYSNGALVKLNSYCFL